MTIPVVLVIVAAFVLVGIIFARSLQPKPLKPVVSIIPNSERPPSSDPELRHFYFQVHGIRHKNPHGSSRQDIIRRCGVGEELNLVPEPTNPYDSDAVKVCRKNGEQLGYIPSDWSFRMAHDMKIGWTYRVTVDEIWDDGGTVGCKIRLGVITMSSRTTARRRKKTGHRDLPPS